MVTKTDRVCTEVVFADDDEMSRVSTKGTKSTRKAHWLARDVVEKELGHLAHAKSIQNLQKYFIYPKWDTCYANFSNFGTSCTVLATVPNWIRNLFSTRLLKYGVTYLPQLEVWIFWYI